MSKLNKAFESAAIEICRGAIEAISQKVLAECDSDPTLYQRAFAVSVASYRAAMPAPLRPRITDIAHEFGFEEQSCA